jgi:urea transport system ATP-binding protein
MSEVNENTVLKVNSVSVCFDGFYALTEVDVAVQRNTVHFFIGPNGAGKTTLLDIICAKTKPTLGTVSIYPKGKERIRLTGVHEYQIARLGVGRKFQVPSVFVNLSVLDNMILSLKRHKKILDSIFGRPSKEELANIDSILEKVGLSQRKDVKAGSLAHGEKQWLEIAMQIAAQPELIMLDEPVAGMGRAETDKTAGILAEIKKECTVIVVEHDMEFVKMAADTVTVLHEGKVLTEGNINDVLADKTVQAVYLGRGGELNVTPDEGVIVDYHELPEHKENQANA